MTSELTKENAALFGQKVSALVRDYIVAQNSIFKFSFAKALGFKNTDYAGAAHRVETLKSQADALLAQVRALKLDADDPLGNFYMTLRPYLREIGEAMDFFIALCEKMETAKREKDKAYWRDQHEADLKEFQAKELKYMAIGKELDDRWKELTGKNNPTKKVDEKKVTKK